MCWAACFAEYADVYESRVYEVDPGDVAVGDYLPRRTWYDARGQVMKTAAAGGLFRNSPSTDSDERWRRTPLLTPTRRPTPTPTPTTSRATR